MITQVPIGSMALIGSIAEGPIQCVVGDPVVDAGTDVVAVARPSILVWIGNNAGPNRIQIDVPIARQ